MAGQPWHQQETFKSLTTLATEALKFIALINGGGAVAVVAYGLGKLPNQSILWPMLGFLTGTLFTALTYVLAYLTQLRLYGETAGFPGANDGGHQRYMRLCFVFAMFAVLGFIGGCISVVAALSR